jgi:hypothetical protein
MLEEHLAMRRHDDADGVDADGADPRMRPAPGLREPSQPRELLRGDGLERMAEGDAGARLDLDEDGLALLTGDQVDLALRTPPVALDDLEAGLRQISCGESLTAAAQLVFRCHVRLRPRSWQSGAVPIGRSVRSEESPTRASPVREPRP